MTHPDGRRRSPRDRADRPVRRGASLGVALFVVAAASVGCERGCASVWLRKVGGVGEAPPSAPRLLPGPVVDCPDGLARCESGTVLVSRLSAIPQPCRGPEGACACPWEAVGTCDRGCVADGLEVVVERAHAMDQLCAPEPDAGAFAVPVPPGPGLDVRCDEPERYSCRDGWVFDCAARVRAARCLRGCFAEGASVDESAPPVGRENAYAILCSR